MCRATIGSVGNSVTQKATIGKAGRNRWKGRRPRVRGVAMNPVDHPMGGGEGRTSGGGHPVHLGVSYLKAFRQEKNQNSRIHKFLFAEMAEELSNILYIEIYVMTRSIKKGFFVEPGLMKKVITAQNAGDRKPIKTWSRRSTITPDFVGLNFTVHNGKSFLTSLCY